MEEEVDTVKSSDCLILENQFSPQDNPHKSKGIDSGDTPKAPNSTLPSKQYLLTDYETCEELATNNITQRTSLLAFKRAQISKVIRKDQKAIDLKISLYNAACNSYRYSSCLYPHPPNFQSDDDAGYANIIDMNQQILSVKNLHEALLREDKEINSYLDLLHWLLISLKDPVLVTVDKKEHDSILAKVSGTLDVQKPSEIFKLNYSSSNEMKWNKTKKGYGTLYGYHGSRLDNFHSILHFGLCQNFCKKDSLFGPGIYLSTELSISLHYSHSGLSWNKSNIGKEISIVALAEYVNHPDVRCHRGRKKYSSGSSFKLVPHKYFVIPNSDLVKVRYLLVYVTKPPTNSWGKPSSLPKWISKYRLLFFLFSYIILLICVGLSNNSFFQRTLKNVFKKL